MASQSKLNAGVQSANAVIVSKILANINNASNNKDNNKKNSVAKRLKIKPISLVMFTLFTQPTILAKQAVAEEMLSLRLSQQLSTQPQIEKSATNNSNLILVDASTDAEASTIPSTPIPLTSISTTSGQYGLSKKTLLAAEVTDANPARLSAVAKENAKRQSIDIGTDKGKNTLPFDTKSTDSKAVDLQLKDITVRAKRFYQIGPLPGLGLTKEEIPGNVQSITAKEIKESHALSLTDLMNSKLQSVNVNDYQSNPFQMDVTYRGFTASPQLGTAQGLSVFLDGIRVNEPFGDVVNWDMIPLNALNGLDVFPGSNPIFGLGTLGGAISMRTKSGFDANEGTIEAMGGSFNRKQFQGSIGGNNGVIAGFAATNVFKEDGWRDNSPSKVNQLFGKAEWRNEKLQFGLSGLYAGNKLTGNGLLPTEIAQQDRSQVFTSPDVTENKLLQFQLTGQWDVSDTFNVTGQVYRRKSRRNSSTSDINQDFGGSPTRRPAAGEQIIPGYADINTDGLPDYNAVPENIALDAIGIPIDTAGNSFFIDDGTGNFINNPSWNGTPLVGSNFYTQAHPNQGFINSSNGTVVPSWGSIETGFGEDVTSAPVIGLYNAALPGDYYQFALNNWRNKALYVASGVPRGSATSDGRNTAVYDASNEPTSISDASYIDANGFAVAIKVLAIVNANEVLELDGSGALNSKISLPDRTNRLGKPYVLYQKDANGNYIQRDGALPDPLTGIIGEGAGYVEGTANALITKTEVDQTTDGGALQLNWNLEKHKFMVGASVDSANSTYQSGQYLGLLDAKHNGALAPDKLGYEYFAATNPVSLNDFKGDSVTKSVYFTDTWSPVKSLSITGAARYNATTIKNLLSTNNIIGVRGANSFVNLLDFGQLCTDVDGNGTVEGSECQAGIDNFIIPFSPESAMGLGALGKEESEKFHYYSFNPSFGATWQANEATNIYGNWSRGARTPSVIELGCAYDDTPVPYLYGPDGKTVIETRPRTLSERRFCSLPSTLSGDPYLKQVRSETYETGIRGKLTENIEWNASVYRTDLTDDIYFVSFRPERSFFQNIGNTRRQGLEMGIKGKTGKLSFGLNYSLTDATFQSAFRMGSPNNSEAGTQQTVGQCGSGNTSADCLTLVDYQQIKVKPGNRIPGVPLHNINANVSYEITQDWNVGLSAILHSSAFVRGNENNAHQTGPAKPVEGTCSRLVNIGDQDGDGIDDFNNENFSCQIARPDFKYGGKTAGYAVFNFNTAFKVTKGLTAGLQITNLFDAQYASAGRLGINPFSPSIRGAIDPVSGFNYNSNDWQNTTFQAPGAPRSAYFTLTYDFNPSEKQ